MKRFTAIFVVFLIAFSSMTVNVSAATPVISIENTQADAGKTVILDVVIKDNPGISGLYLRLRYDSPLKLISVKDKGIIKGKYFSSSTDTVPYVLSWDNSVSGNNNYANGILAQLEFSVPKHTPDGVYNVSISYEEGDIFNAALDNVSFVIINGSITVGTQYIFEDTDDMYRSGEYFFFTEGKAVGDIVRSCGPGSYVTDAYGKKNESMLLAGGDTLYFPDNSRYICILRGDNDSDGRITAADARFALRCSVGLETAEKWQLMTCDVDSADGITAADARLILRASVGLENADNWVLRPKWNVVNISSDSEFADKPIKTPASQYNAAGHYVTEQLKKFVTFVDISEYKIRYDDGKVFIKEFINVVPELFYVVNSVKVSSDNGLIEHMEFTFIDNAREKVKEYNTLLSDISEKADESWSDLQKILFFHDYICINFSYDKDLNIYDAYSMLKNGKGVCQAYTLLMKALLQTHSIEAKYVTSERMQHGWNLVKLDSRWYHVDVTWDDMERDVFGHALHENILLSDDAIEDNGHKDWYCFGGNESCTDKTYDNYFWMDVTSPFVCLDNKWYYIDEYESGYAVYNWTGGGKHVIKKSLFSKWTGFMGFSLSDCYSSLCVYDDKLLYNTDNTVVSFDPVSGERRILYYENTSKQIFGMRVNDGIYINLASSATANGVFAISFMYQGDCDNDSRITGKDYAAVIKYLAGHKNTINTRNADFDFNGNLNQKDAEALRKFIVN